MIIFLLLATFVVSCAIVSLVVVVFRKPITNILGRIVPADIKYAWARYLWFALYVVGIGSGVRVWSLEKYLILQEPYKEIVQLTPDRWMLEMYETVIGTLQGTAMLLLVFFIFALIAVVMIRVFESRSVKTDTR